MSFSPRGSQVLTEELKRVISSVFFGECVQDLRMYFPEHFAKLEKAVKVEQKGKELAALLKGS